MSSLMDQLNELHRIAIYHNLYAAADWVAAQVERSRAMSRHLHPSNRQTERYN